MSVRNDVVQSIIDVLRTSLTSENASESFGVQVKSVQQLQENLITMQSYDLPIIVVVDDGDEEVKSRDAVGTRYNATCNARCLVKDAEIKATTDSLNNIVGAIKRVVDTSNTWHARCLHVSVSVVRTFRFDGNILGYENAAECSLTIGFVYYRLKDES